MTARKLIQYNMATLFERGESLSPGIQPISNSRGGCGDPSVHASRQDVWGQSFLAERGLFQADEKTLDGRQTIGRFSIGEILGSPMGTSF